VVAAGMSCADAERLLQYFSGVLVRKRPSPAWGKGL
jgi:hypothetical protein